MWLSFRALLLWVNTKRERDRERRREKRERDSDGKGEKKEKMERRNERGREIQTAKGTTDAL